MENTIALPHLREDLNLFEGPRQRDGSPTWTLHDPLRNLYFRIGWTEFELLSRFRLGSGDAVLKETGRLGLVGATEEKLAQLIQFLQQNELIVNTAAESGSARRSPHSLFFFKIPLFHPDPWLGGLVSLLSLFFSPLFFWLVMGVGAATIWMLLQQWDQFWNTFVAYQTPVGVAAFAAAILFSKLIHELGHGLTAKHFGLRVPSFGVAFMFLWPVFYTDTSDAWRLHSRRSRLLIGGAGMVAETLLAIVASLCWLWLPDGVAKAVAFTVAATTWSITLLVNLNPFMRFDGYFLLSDGWNIANLQPRSFELGRRYLQSLVMGTERPAPLSGEQRGQSLWLIGYAYMTWLYRLSLYIGLALVAYHLLFKLLGIVLLAVEMGVLVVKPIATELRRYWRERGAFRWVGSNRGLLLLSVLLVSLLVTPWRGEVVAPAVWKETVSQSVYSPADARVSSIEVAVGDKVEAGQPLIQLAMPELEYQREMLELQIGEQRAILQGVVMDRKGGEQRLIEQQRLDSLVAQQQQVTEKLSKKVVVAPLSGEVVELDKVLMEGVWVAEGGLLAVVADGDRPSVTGYFHERELGRLKVGSLGRLLPEHPLWEPIPVVLTDISVTNLTLLDEPLLASLYRGALPVRELQRGELLLQQSYYRVTFEPKHSPQLPVQLLRGEVVVEAEASTYLQRGWDTLQTVLIQESGF